MSESEVIRIPRRAQNWRVNQLPFPTRLRTLLRRSGRTTLGALHGLSLEELFDTRGCGVHSLDDFRRFLRRLHARELDEQASVDSSAVPRAVLKKIDEFCDTLDARDRKILLMRLGAHGDPLTLQAVGDKYRLTRERVRQIIDTHVARLSRSGGPPFMAVIRTLIGKLEKAGRASKPKDIAGRLRSFRVRGRYS